MATTYYTRDMMDDAVREELGPGVRDLLPEVDGIFKEITYTSAGVTSSGIGRDWKVKQTFCTSVAGAYKFQSAAGGAIAGGRQNPFISYSSSTPQAFQNVGEVIAPGLEMREISLVMGMGNFFLPVHVFQMNQLDAAIMDYVNKNIKMTAMNVAQMHAVAFYKTYVSGTTSPIMARVNGTSSTYSWGTSGHTYAQDSSTAVGDSADNFENRVEVPIDTGRIRMFYPGQVVDAFSSGGTNSSNQLNTKDLVVQAVDYINGTVVLETIANDSDSAWVDGLSDNDILIPRDCTDGTSWLGPSGLEDWMVSSGTLYGMNTNKYPQLRSEIKAVSAPLTETILNQYIGSTMENLRGLVNLDTIITTGGVVRQYLDGHSDLGVFQRQGTSLNIQGGWADIGYTYGGKKFKWLISPYCAPGNLYCLETGNGNIRRYHPPKIPQTGSNNAFDGECQFYAQLAGSNSIFKPAHNTSGYTTDFVEAPFFDFKEIAPERPQGVKLTSLTELNA